MSFPRYPKYKDSGVAWLGEMPTHWEIKRVKHVFQERDDRSRDGSETLLSVSAYTGVSPRSEVIEEGDHLSRAESLEGYKICYPNDLVINIMLAWNRGLAFTCQAGIVSPAYSVFHVIDGSSPSFLNYLVRADETILYYKAFSAGVIDSRLRLYPDAFGRLYMALPPPQEQQFIASFLDRETAKIDALVAEQEKLIARLKEKRQAVISHAVTKGLNRNAKMKDSGIAWLGEVPEHWKVWKLTHAFGVIGSGTTPKSDNSAYYEEGTIPWLNTGDLSDGVLNDCEKRITELALKELSLKVYPPGSVVIALYGATIGKLAVLNFHTTVNQACCVFSNALQVMPKFMFYWFLAMRQPIISLATGGGQPNISQEILRSLRVACPALEEQAFIVESLDREITIFDDLVTEAACAIGLLKERRSALISAAVTGKIDVRNAVISTKAGMTAEEVAV